MTRPWQAPPDVLARVAQRLLRTLVAPAIPYLPLLANGHTVGWLTPQRASRIAAWASLFRVNNDAVEVVGDAGATAMTTSLDEIARTLSREGALSAWRDEPYAVRDPVQGGVLFEVERAAARYLGIHTRAAHINGVVRVDERWRMWLARRSVVKAIDPGLLDNLVGGGIAAGMTVASTLIKEAWEEAGISAGLAAEAIPVGAVQICRDQPDGLHRETIYTHDLWLAGEFFPNNQDGEAVEHHLCEPDEVLSIIATDDITADASLVIIDFLIRHGHVPPDDPSFDTLDCLRHASTRLAVDRDC